MSSNFRVNSIPNEKKEYTLHRECDVPISVMHFFIIMKNVSTINNSHTYTVHTGLHVLSHTYMYMHSIIMNTWK